nr:hypothetical protein [Candidatus Sigynarchaeota archaeon]
MSGKGEKIVEKGSFQAEIDSDYADFEELLNGNFYSLKLYSSKYHDIFKSSWTMKKILLFILIIASLALFLSVGIIFWYYPYVYLVITENPQSADEFLVGHLRNLLLFFGLSSMFCVIFGWSSKSNSEDETARDHTGKEIGEKIKFLMGSELDISIMDKAVFLITILLFIEANLSWIIQNTPSILLQIDAACSAGIVLCFTRLGEKKVSDVARIFHCFTFLRHSGMERKVGLCVKILLDSFEDYFDEERIIIMNKPALAINFIERLVSFDDKTMKTMANLMTKESFTKIKLIHGSYDESQNEATRIYNLTEAKKWFFGVMRDLFCTNEEAGSGKTGIKFQFEQKTLKRKMREHAGTVITVVSGLVAIIPTLMK